MMNTFQTLILLVAGLSVEAVSLEDKALNQFRRMIICVMPDSRPVFDYADYGCYCGTGGFGTPVDDLDMCCQVHDQCYGDALQHPECTSIIDNPYTKIYDYSCDENNKTVTCGLTVKVLQNGCRPRDLQSQTPTLVDPHVQTLYAT